MKERQHQQQPAGQGYQELEKRLWLHRNTPGLLPMLHTRSDRWGVRSRRGVTGYLPRAWKSKSSFPTHGRDSRADRVLTVFHSRRKHRPTYCHWRCSHDKGGRVIKSRHPCHCSGEVIASYDWASESQVYMEKENSDSEYVVLVVIVLRQLLCILFSFLDWSLKDLRIIVLLPVCSDHCFFVYLVPIWIILVNSFKFLGAVRHRTEFSKPTH